MTGGLVLRSAAESALDYAELDLSVFPVAPDCRRPLTEHGWKDATCDRARTAELWRGRAFANVAMATGVPSGVFALDVDAKDGKDGFAALAALEARQAPLPTTWRSRTPSGGAHIFFVQPDGRTLRNKVNLPVEGFSVSGLDVRSTGASVALPPSRKAAGIYTWEIDPLAVRAADAPDWLLHLIDPGRVQHSPRAVPPVANLDRRARYVASAVNRGCEALARMAPGSGRNDALFRLAARCGQFIAAGGLPQDMAEDELTLAAERCGLLREDGAHAVRSTIASGLRRGRANPAELPA